MSDTSNIPASSPDDTPVSNPMLGKWLYDSSEEGPWYTSDEQETKEDAIIAAIHDYGLEVGAVVWVGKIARMSFPSGFMSLVCLEQIAESFGERLDEEIGESAEDFDWFGRKEELEAKKTKDSYAWRRRDEIQREVCYEIEKVIEAEMRKRGIWVDNRYFVLDAVEGVTIDQAMFDASMKEYE